jgi:hypothetical protein
MNKNDYIIKIKNIVDETELKKLTVTELKEIYKTLKFYLFEYFALDSELELYSSS